MGTDRIRVREPIDVAGLLILLAMLGLFCGAMLVLTHDPIVAVRLSWEQRWRSLVRSR